MIWHLAGIAGMCLCSAGLGVVAGMVVMAIGGNFIYRRRR